jgi:signal recognition particle subunit SRP54
MFENLSEKLQRSFKTLRGQGTITEENISDAMREIRVALLESDVNLKVVDDLVEHIRVKAMGTQVTTALSPSEQIVKIVHDELAALLGKDIARFRTASQPPSVVLMAGLQGSGKTTTSAKLAQWLKKGGHRPMLVSVDVYRPAARQQLAIVAKSTTPTRSTAHPTSSGSPKKPGARPPTSAATSSSSTPPAASASTRRSWMRWPS